MTESRKRRFGVALLLILVNSFAIIGVIVLGVVAFQQSERAAIAESEAAAEDEQRNQDIEALRDQVFELGETPVVAPPTPGATTPPRDGRDGEDGKDGIDGQSATSEQIASAVATWCAANGNCIGPPGRPGSDGREGTDGRDSTTPGPPGPQGERGPAGPVCPDGYSAATVWVAVAETVDGAAVPEQATICRITPAPDPAPNPSGDTP